MRTDDFIHMLSQDEVIDKPSRLSWALALGGTIMLGFVLIAYMRTGMFVRPEYFSYFTGDVLVAAKQIAPLLLMFALYFPLRQLQYPETKFDKKMLVPLAIYAVFMAGLFVYSWITTPEEAHGMAIEGKSRLKCLVSIPIFSLVIYAFALMAIKAKAPSYPQHTALIAGLVCAGLGTAIYAFGCTEDSPLFYALWYNLGIVIATLIAVLIGRSVLKW